MRNFAARKEHYALIFRILIKKIIKKNEKNISASQSSSREQAWLPRAYGNKEWLLAVLMAVRS